MPHRVVDAPDFHDGDDRADGLALGHGEIGAHLAVAECHLDVLRFHVRAHSFIQRAGIARKDRVGLVFRQFERANAADRVGDERTPPLRVEWRVGGEQALCRAEEGVAAFRRRLFAAQRGVGVEHPVIIERRPLEAALFGDRITIDGAEEDLPEAELNLGREIRDHAAHVMADDLQRRQFVEQPGIDQPRHAGGRLVGPAERKPDFVFRDLLGGIVRKIRAAHRMDPDRQIVLGPCAGRSGGIWARSAACRRHW